MAMLKPILAAVILALAYVCGYRLRFVESIHPRRWLSFGAGVAVAYVFVELLPELAEYQDRFLAATAQQAFLFAERRVFLAALVGFVLYYGLENFVAWSRASRTVRGQEGHTPLVYRLHLGGFAAYSSLIGYVLIREPESEPLALAFYTIAMFLHFLGIDHSLDREHGRIYQQRGKWILAAATFAGCLVGILIKIPDRYLATLMGFIAGGVVVNSMVMELPKEKEGRFWAFCTGALLYSLLLLVA
jgi:uncharacterized membrane protein required for colicin V production